jgi:hypothetical protein
MDEGQEYFMPMKVCQWLEAVSYPWEDKKTSLAELSGVPGAVAFTPVYPSIEALEAVHGHVPFQRVRLLLASEHNP